MKNGHARIKALVCVLFVLVLIMAAWFAHARIGQAGMQFVAGKFGTICYLKGSVSRKVIYPVYFRSFEECRSYVQINAGTNR